MKRDYTKLCLQCDEPMDLGPHTDPLYCRDAQARHILALKERVAELEAQNALFNATHAAVQAAQG